MCSLKKFNIDTKGCCLLCFRSQISRKEIEDEIGGERSSSVNPGFKILIRYLQVDMAKLPFFSSTYQRLNCPLKNVDLSVSLCEDCSSVTNDFSELFQTYEGIRIQMDLCIRQLIEFMETGSKDKDSVQEYERRMITGDIQDMISTTIAEGLRNETKSKAFQKVASSVPRVPLSKNSDELEGTSQVSLREGPNVQPNPEPKNSFVAEVNQTVNGKCNPGNGSLPTSLNLENENSSLLQMIQRLSNKWCQKQLLPTRPVIPDTPPAEEVGLEKRLSANSKCDSQVQTTEVINGDSLRSTPHTKPVEDPSRFKCIYCEKKFAQERNLTTHHYHSHSMAILRDKGLIPPNITEQLLNTSLEEILDQSKNNQCPVCKEVGFRWKFQVRSHLLHSHLPQIMEKVEEGNNGGEKIPKILLRWKCVPCGEEFPSQGAFDSHQFQSHPMSILTEKGLLPSDITENQLEAEVVGMLTHSGCCKICKKGRSPTIDHLRAHLLLKHLPRLIDSARNRVATGTGNELGTWNMGNGIRRSSRMLERKKAGVKQSRTDFRVQKVLLQNRRQINRRRRKGKAPGPRPVSAIKNKYMKPKKVGVNAWKCVPCRRNFPTKFRLDDHQLQMHTMSMLKNHFPRSVSAGTMSASMNSLVDQMKRISRNVHGGTLFQCFWCEKKVWLATRVKLHLLKCHLKQVIQVMGGNEVDYHTGEGPSQTKCEYCEKDFSKRNYLELHKWTQHTFAHLSNTCNIPAHVTEQHLNQTLTDLETPNEFNLLKCQICKKGGFQSSCRLRAHLFVNHVDEVAQFVVDLANRDEQSQPTTSTSARRPPQTQVSGGGGRKRFYSTFTGSSKPRHQCNYCGHRSPSERGLSIHHAKVHRIINKAKPPYKCEHCENIFWAQSSITVHLISSHPTKAFEDVLPIWVTDEDFNNAAAWISRMGEKIVKDPGHGIIPTSYLFECPLCKQQLDRGSRLKLHIARYHLDHVVKAMEGGNVGR